MISLVLSMPPSTNTLYRNVPGKGRVRTARYRTWAVSAGWELKSQKPKPIDGPVDIRVAIGPPRKGWDADNRVKAVSDLLVEHRLIEDDSWPTVRSVHAEWHPEIDGCVVSVFPVQDKQE